MINDYSFIKSCTDSYPFVGICLIALKKKPTMLLN